MTNQYDFHEQLRKSNDPEVENMLIRAYSAAFGSVVRWEREENKDKQLSGIDRHLWVGSGEHVTVEEKVRFSEKSTTADFLLEYVSNDKRMSAGWALKPIAADILCFLWTREQTAIMFPAPVFSLVVQAYIEQWLKAHPLHPAGTKRAGYQSLNVAVPYRALLIRLKGVVRVNLLSYPYE